MYGATCLGFSTDYASMVGKEAIKRGLTGYRTDSMGMSGFVYWPNVSDLKADDIMCDSADYEEAPDEED